ncbi:MAG: glycosyltransferase [Prevotella sp.]|uniref:glycosyltransferase n=1 Tax=Prevotella sp. TaxID=59823 RepID=UPI002A2C4F98|nr:glycosyltransferase [Prevotella sp.]MDD7319150.1 glycosyltransferase [Prevotellaceae bacterium]MDY4020018.1 glycosyltransferase [Prevotella sp.]
MNDRLAFPDYIFESSWEVCNKVGGIYTVLSTRARTLQNRMKDKIIFIGPDCWKETVCPYFIEDERLFSDWRKDIVNDGLHVRIGRWDIPGTPIAMLVDFMSFFEQKNEIYARAWEDFQVDSIHAYGDYDEASMFAYSAGLLVESFYKRFLDSSHNVIYHGNEWMTGLGVLHINKVLPGIGTVFTTHATSIGRSIAGNNKPLYEYLLAYNGDGMACELNMQSKHSVEKQTAKFADCFTTVSEITANECKELLDKQVDVILPNGFDDSFVPKGNALVKARKAARKRLLEVANALLGTSLDDDTLIVSTSGRYEFRNKGIDVYIEAINMLRHENGLEKNVLALIEVPGWVAAPRKDLSDVLAAEHNNGTPLDVPQITHRLHDMDNDKVLGMMRSLDMYNRAEDKVKLIFVPCYLTGDDGIFNMSYYDLLTGSDICIYPSYYEPWGYTPLEAIAFKVPCITTDLAGFGMWANSEKGTYCEIEDGVKVVHRTDYNYNEVASEIKDTLLKYSKMTTEEVRECCSNALKLSKKALWSNFIKHYEQAYDIALRKAEDRK